MYLPSARGHKYDMENKFYFKVNLPFEVSLSSLHSITNNLEDRSEYSGPIEVPRKLVDKNLIKFLLDKNIEIIHTCVFYTPPNYKKVIHVDESKFDDHCKINFVFGPSGYMRWWEPKDANLIEKKYTKIGTDYLYIEEDNCNLVYEVKPEGSCIVNVGFFHSVENDGDQERWCLSHVLYSNTKKKLLTISDAKEILMLN